MCIVHYLLSIFTISVICLSLTSLNTLQMSFKYCSGLASLSRALCNSFTSSAAFVESMSRPLIILSFNTCPISPAAYSFPATLIREGVMALASLSETLLNRLEAAGL